ncbi:two-component regulator propeller domain-containing protein [Paradesertivirga mongoliensis]|uniref:histidine kinase n=1 Tax=Paradesertivirga mongoliensis TaxID=2100740 RepID=A0ABW4ZQH7_9SPHI|nr:two-component regulator propeller domain-containing protein [Pedobacter mongoliensis]
MKYFFVSFSLIVALYFKSSAVDYPRFEYLGIEHGLSNNAVTSIYQDKFGFMWFGTYDGLNRFDGYNFKVFRNTINDSTSLSNDRVVTIHDDRSNNLWVGTKNGVSIYNRINSKFSSLSFTFRKERRRLTNPINDIKSDRGGNILIGSAGEGLVFYTWSKKEASKVPLRVGKKLEYGYHVQSIDIDHSNRVWLFIQNKGICRFDYKTKSVYIVNTGIKTGICMETDLSGNIWVGNENGLYRYGVESRKFESIDVPNSSDMGLIHGLTFDKSGELWICTDANGLTVLNTTTFAAQHIYTNKNKGSLTSLAVSTMFEDKDGRKWLGTLRGGINLIDQKKDRFSTIAHNPFDKNSIINDFILSFCEDDNGKLWIGTDGAGLSYWDRNKNVFSHYYHDSKNPASLTSNNIARIIKDYKGDIWIATYGGGINKFNKARKSFEYYPCFNPDLKFHERYSWTLFEDRNKNLWAGNCADGGLYIFNRQRNKFELFDNNLKNVITLTADKSGQLWAGTFYSLFKIDTIHKRHDVYPIGQAVRAIYEDRKGDFWVGTEGGGLLLFNRKNGSSTNITRQHGLAGNSVLNILEDKQQNLWISTFTGLSKLSANRKNIRNYYGSDGLQSNQFNYNAALKLSSGEFLFGGIKGFNIFYPKDIRPINRNPEIFITGLRINNLPYEADGSSNRKKSVYELTEIVIPYDKAVLSVDFAALEYSAPDKIAYTYYLEGWDKSWNTAGKSRIANYSRLREGTYLLKIKSTNTEGVWASNERVLKIKILAPWWRSWWAYCFYVALFVGILYCYSLYQRRQERLKYQIELANIKVEQEHELNERKLSFFTNISHEFRTPLTLIINPIKEFLNDKNGQIDPKDLIVVYRNARRLLSLVDQLLHFRKSDTDDLKVSKVNLVTFCREVYLCFIQQAKIKDLNFDFISPEDEIEIYADKEKLEIALFNLISNAFKYTPSGGKITLTLFDLDSEVELLVKDTGMGISEDVGAKLFDVFYQGREKDRSGKAGFGIGLHLVKKFIEGNAGRVSYTSKKGVGTEFKINLLKGKEHFDPSVIEPEVTELPVFLEELVEDYEENSLAENVNEDPSREMISEKSSMLIVEDDEDLRRYIKQLFQPSYLIYEADSAESGYELARKHIPDIIVTDVIMGKLSGVELCLQIKNEASLNHIPIILLTSSSSSEIKLKGIESGADDYITKPFDKEILTARVANLLKSKSNLQRYFYNQITFKSDDSTVSAEYKEFLEKCIAITEKHLSDSSFSVHTLASEMGISYSSLYQKVKTISGRSANEFIRFIRLRKAAELFINTDCRINEGAFRCGFNDMKHFREQFSKVYGMNPSEYIKKYRKAFKKLYKFNEKVNRS